MDENPAGSSSAIEQHVIGDAAIRSRRYPPDVVGSSDSIASSDPSTSDEEGDGPSAQQSDNGLGRAPESDSPPPLESPPPEAGDARTPEEKQCRICLAGAEEEAELGRLISPCHCRGSIRYVHVNCLKQWRTLSQSRSAFWSCPQCGFRYAFARTRALGLATSPVILSSASVILFTIIVFLSSFLATYFIPDVESLNEPIMTNQRVRDSDSFFSFGGVVISPFDYYTYSWDTAKDVFKFAVRTFSDISNAEHEYEFWRRDEDEQEADDDILDENKYERVRTSGKGFKSTVKVAQNAGKQRQKSARRKSRPPSRFTRLLRGFVYRFTTGLGVVGILSFLNLVFSFGLFAPLRLFGGNWNRGQRGRGAASDTASIVVVIFIVIGVVRAVWLVYKLTRHIAQLLLRRAETAILEVGQADEVAEPEPWGPYLKRVARELPAQLRSIPYRLLPGMVFGWLAMAFVQSWHAMRNWTRDALGQMMQVGPQQGVPVVGHQRGIFLGDW